MKNIEEARKEIQNIDAEIAELFSRRMAAAKYIAAYKKERGLQVFDAEQEKKVLARCEDLMKDEVLKPYYLQFVQNTMDISKKYQKHLMAGTRVAFSGVEGAFAHIAAKRIFPDSECVPLSSFEAAYLSVVEGECDYAVLPIENSYSGEVGQVMDLMFHGSLFVNGVYNMQVVHDLLGIPDADISDIRTVVSHPQALSQCRPYIKIHSFNEINEINTAVAAERVAKTNDKTLAAIGSEETAALYGLKILDHDINEKDDNTTRFAVFSRTENNDCNTKNGETFILLFRVNNVAGALADGIQVIGKYGFNMKVLRSRPIKTISWKYYFYVEAEGNPYSKIGMEMIEELKEHCDMLKVVGTFVSEDNTLKGGDRK